MLAEKDRDRALQIYRDLQQRNDIREALRIDAVDILLLIGEDYERVKEELRRIRSSEADRAQDGYSVAMFKKLTFLLDEMEKTSNT